MPSHIFSSLAYEPVYNVKSLIGQKSQRQKLSQNPSRFSIQANFRAQKKADLSRQRMTNARA